jgi:hypothetical protein
LPACRQYLTAAGNAFVMLGYFCATVLKTLLSLFLCRFIAVKPVFFNSQSWLIQGHLLLIQCNPSLIKCQHRLFERHRSLFHGHWSLIESQHQLF